MQCLVEIKYYLERILKYLRRAYYCFCTITLFQSLLGHCNTQEL